MYVEKPSRSNPRRRPMSALLAEVVYKTPLFPFLLYVLITRHALSFSERKKRQSRTYVSACSFPKDVLDQSMCVEKLLCPDLMENEL
jgi:hypothetical protein